MFVDNSKPLENLHVTIEPKEKTTLSAEVVSKVIAIHKKLGDHFEKGDLLVEFDDTIFQDNFAKTLAVLKKAETMLTAKKELFKAEIASRFELSEAQAAFATAQSDFTIAKTQLEACRIYAPYTGKVAYVHIELFEYPRQQGEPIVDIIDDSTLLAKALVPVNGWHDAKVDQTIYFQLETSPDIVLARIKHIAPNIDPSSSTFQIIAEIDNHDNYLASGMTGTSISQQAYEQRVNEFNSLVLREKKKQFFPDENITEISKPLDLYMIKHWDEVKALFTLHEAYINTQNVFTPIQGNLNKLALFKNLREQRKTNQKLTDRLDSFVLEHWDILVLDALPQNEKIVQGVAEYSVSTKIRSSFVLRDLHFNDQYVMTEALTNKHLEVSKSTVAVGSTLPLTTSESVANLVNESLLANATCKYVTGCHYYEASSCYAYESLPLKLTAASCNVEKGCHYYEASTCLANESLPLKLTAASCNVDEGCHYYQASTSQANKSLPLKIESSSCHVEEGCYLPLEAAACAVDCGIPLRLNGSCNFEEGCYLNLPVESCVADCGISLQLNASTCTFEEGCYLNLPAESCTTDCGVPLQLNASTCTFEEGCYLNLSTQGCTADCGVPLQINASICTFEEGCYLNLPVQNCTADCGIPLQLNASTCTFEEGCYLNLSAQSCTADCGAPLQINASACTFEEGCYLNLSAQSCDVGCGITQTKTEEINVLQCECDVSLGKQLPSPFEGVCCEAFIPYVWSPHACTSCATYGIPLKLENCTSDAICGSQIVESEIGHHDNN